FMTQIVLLRQASHPAFSVLLAALLLAVFAGGCSEKPQQASAPGAQDGGKAGAAAGKLTPGEILGQVGSFALTDQSGQPLTNEQLQGKVWFAAFMYSRSTLNSQLQSVWLVKLQQRLQQDPSWDDIHVVSVTVDPQHDTPDVLQEFAKGFEADPEHWHFLTGDAEEIQRLAKDQFQLPFSVKDQPSGQITLDDRVALVDRRGRIRGVYDVVADGGLEPVIRDLATVLPEFLPSSVEWGGDDVSLPVTHLAQPPEILTSRHWLAKRVAAQQASMAESGVSHDFQLTDQVAESGITWRNQILDEQRSRLQVNHFDHGNGICTADIDADGLPDLFFVNQAGPNALYRNLGNGRFEDVTAQSGLAIPNLVKVAAAFADVNNDGLPDAFLTTVRGGNLLFLNEGEGKFRDVTEEYGVGYSGHSSGAVFFDYNQDGFLDLFVANVGKYTTDELVTVRADRTTELPEEPVKYHAGIKDAFGGHLKPELTETSLLYRNEGGTRFTEVSAETGLVDAGWAGAALPMDVNEDGWIDLYVMNMQGHDTLYENQEGKSFAARTEAYFAKTPWGAMGGGVFDINNDGHFDLMLTDMHSDMSETVVPAYETSKARMQWPETFLRSEGKSLYGNAFYRSQGDGKFEEVSDAIGAENFWPWGMSVGDLNADGYEDVFVASSMCFPYRYATNTMLLNVHGTKLIPAECVLGIEPRQKPLIAPWFELDCDGEDRENPLCRDRSGRLVIWSAVGSRSSLLEDLDLDGDLDLVTNDFNSGPQMLFSNLAERNPDLHYVRIRLRGTTASRDGLGAQVMVKAGEQQWLQQHDGQSGYLSQSSHALYFGLGDLTTVDEITVFWPGGHVQTVSGPIPCNQQLEVVEPDDSSSAAAASSASSG
ncbi:MAG: VCBS repeat-containing protein, partial [Planctomycetaceae bacterium]|nr:VCBS repeat-containing protein [Planctomycetaceae bacterium]